MTSKKPQKDLFLSKSKGAGLLGKKKAQRKPPATADEEVEFKGADDWAAVQKTAKVLKIKLTEAEARQVARGEPVAAKQKKKPVTVRLMDPKNPKTGLIVEEELLRNPREDLNGILLKLLGLDFDDVTDQQGQDILDGADLELVRITDGLTYLVGRYDKTHHVRATNLGDGPDLCSDPAELASEPASPGKKAVRSSWVKATIEYTKGDVVYQDGGNFFFAARAIKPGDLLYEVLEDGGFHVSDSIEAIVAEVRLAPETLGLGAKVIDGDGGAWYATGPVQEGSPVLYATDAGWAVVPGVPVAWRDEKPEPSKQAALKADANGLDAEVRGHLKALELARTIDIRIRGLESDLDDARAEVKRIKDAIEDSNQELRSTVRAADPGPLFDQRPKCARCGERTTALSQGPTKTPYTDRLLCPDCVRVLIEEQEAAARGEKQAQDAPEPSTTETTPEEPADAPADTEATSCRFCDAGDIPAAKPGDDSGNLFHETADGWVPCVEKAEPSTTGTTPEEPDDMTDPGIDLDSLKFTRAKVREKFFALVERHGAAKVGWTLKPDYLSRGLGCTTKITVGDLKALADTLDG